MTASSTVHKIKWLISTIVLSLKKRKSGISLVLYGMVTCLSVDEYNFIKCSQLTWNVGPCFQASQGCVLLNSWHPIQSSGRAPWGSICPWPRRIGRGTARGTPLLASSLQNDIVVLSYSCSKKNVNTLELERFLHESVIQRPTHIASNKINKHKDK